jgi:hypothetical protein
LVNTGARASPSASPAQRSPIVASADRIAPHEYRLAALQIVETAVGIDREDLIAETARLLGFDRTGADLRAAIDEQINVLLKSGRICSECGHVRLALNAPRAAD